MSRRAVLIEAVSATPRDIERMLRRIDERAASWRPSPEAWSLKEIVSHLSAVESLLLERWRRIVTQDNPHEAAMEPVTAPNAHARPLGEQVDEFMQRRAVTLEFLSSLSQRDWGRPFVHETLGPSRLRDQAQAMVTHDNEHLDQIIALREAIEAREVKEEFADEAAGGTL